MTTDTNAMLAERGQRYGDFMGHAQVTMSLKLAIRSHVYSKDIKMQPDQWEALDMICHKIGRIVNGDPNYVDSWQDIAGYASLVSNRLSGNDLPFG
jgi:hypothetical protein